MFNWLAIKKFLFLSGIAGATGAPIYYLNKPNNEIDKNLKHDKIAKKKQQFLRSGIGHNGGDQYKNLLEEILKTESGKEKVRNFFVQLLSLTWFEQQGESKNRQSLVSWDKAEETEYQKQKNKLSKNSDFLEQSDLLDANGGSRHTMKKNFMSEKAYESFKELLVNFFNYSFTIKKNQTNSDLNSFFVPENNYLSRQDIEKPEDWSNIGFYPILNNRNKDASVEEKKYLIGKFSFLNWAYKKWYAETLPFYTWMVLWKYSGNDLSTKYNLNNIENSKIKNGPNYNLPLFSNVGKKFSDFIKNFISESEPSDNKLSVAAIPFVSKAYTDDMSTSIFTQATNSHSKLYSEFASAANYKFYKSIKEGGNCWNTEHKADAVNAAQSTTDNIHQLSIADAKQLKDPLDIFLLKPSSAAAQTPAKGYIHIDKSIIKDDAVATTGTSTHYTLYETREVEGKDWMFLRNEAGVHAIMVDSYAGANGSCKIKNSFDFFNFRNLQLLHKQSLNLNNTVDTSLDALETFRLYLKSNFDQLIIKYFFNSVDSKKYLFSQIRNSDYFEKFKEVMMLWDEMDFYKTKYMNVYETRKRILGHYNSRNWSIDDTNNVVIADKNSGLSGAFPYRFGTDENSLFPDQEELFDKIKYDKKTESVVSQKNDAVQPSTNETNLSKYEKLFTQMGPAIQALFKSLQLRIAKQNIDFINSSRIFFNDYVINKTYDDLLDNKDLVDLITKSMFLRRTTGSYLGKELISTNFLDSTTLSLKITNTSVAKIKKTDTQEEFKNIKYLQKAFKHFVFSKYLYSHNNQNWFDPLIYSNYLTTKSSGTTTKEKINNFLISASENAFKAHYFFINPNLKKLYIDYLMAFNYLMRDGFENLRKIMETKNDNYSDSFITFQKNTSKFEESKAHMFANPFLNNHDSTNTTTFQHTKTEEFNKLINYRFADPVRTSPPATNPPSTDEYNFLGISSFNDGVNMNSFQISQSNKTQAKNLFAFKDRNNLISYINSCSLEQFNQLIKRLIKKGYAIEVIKKGYVTFNNGSTKDLSLKQKKQGLISFVKHHKFEEKLEESKAKTIFGIKKDGSDDSGWKEVEKNNGESDHAENIKDNEFSTRTTTTDNNYYLLQYNKNDVSSAEEFKTFVNAQLNSDSLAKLLFGMLNEVDIFENAENDFFSKITQRPVYDKKYEDSLNPKFVIKDNE